MLAALHVLPDDAPAHPLPADADADGSGRSIRFSSAIKLVPSQWQARVLAKAAAVEPAPTATATASSPPSTTHD